MSNGNGNDNGNGNGKNGNGNGKNGNGNGKNGNGNGKNGNGNGKGNGEDVNAKEFKEIRTIVSDARYHNQNATNWCFATFVDYMKCNRLLGEEHKSCDQFKKVYRAVCPNEWVARWNEQIEIGTFPVDLPPKENECLKK